MSTHNRAFQISFSNLDRTPIPVSLAKGNPHETKKDFQ